MRLLVAVIALILSVDAQAASRIFYDGFEDGTANAWEQDPFNTTKCPVVTTSVDGVLGPYAGTYMARCNYQTDGNWPQLLLDTSNYTDELFVRMKLRLDNNVNRTGTLNGSDGPAAFKLLRYFHNGDPYHDLFVVAGHNQTGFNTCWNNVLDSDCVYGTGGGPGATSQDSSQWHEMEYYIHQSNGTIKVWHDGTLVINTTGHNFGGRKWTDFYVQSNGASNTTDNTNNWYLDEFEVYSDAGSASVTGTMADGTIALSGGGSSTGGSMDVKRDEMSPRTLVQNGQDSRQIGPYSATRSDVWQREY